MTTGQSKLERLQLEVFHLCWVHIHTRKNLGLAAARAALESERERLRDLIGSLCSRLAVEFAEVGVGFSPVFGLSGPATAVRVLWERPARREYVQEPNPPAEPFDMGTAVDLSEATVAIRVTQEKLFADEHEVSLELLAHDDDPVAERLRFWVRGFLKECETT